MATYTEGALPYEFLQSDLGRISYEQITVASGSGSLSPGRVLAKVTSTGKYVPYDDASATAGVNVAAAILCASVDATAADASATVIARLAEVKATALGWGTQNATQQNNGIADMLATMIVVRAA